MPCHIASSELNVVGEKGTLILNGLIFMTTNYKAIFVIHSPIFLKERKKKLSSFFSANLQYFIPSLHPMLMIWHSLFSMTKQAHPIIFQCDVTITSSQTPEALSQTTVSFLVQQMNCPYTQTKASSTGT
jgi:hypothetical protein